MKLNYLWLTVYTLITIIIYFVFVICYNPHGSLIFNFYCHFVMLRYGMCLTPLSTLFQLYRGGLLYWWRKPQTCLKSQTLSHNVVSSTLRLSGIQTHNMSGDRH